MEFFTFCAFQRQFLTMDFPVEATVHLDLFGNQQVAQDLLRSHGFRLAPLGGGRVRVHGFLSQLKLVECQLEPLVRSPRPSSGSFYGHRDDARSTSGGLPGERGREARSGRPRTSSAGTARATFVTNSDVFEDARHLRRREMEDVLTAHAVSMVVEERGGGSAVTLRGPNSNAAARKLQSPLHHLGNSLRTQEVPRTDRHGDVHDSVLVREAERGLPLVETPRESLPPRRRPKGNAAGGGGRSYDPGARLRSGSLSAAVRGDNGQSLPDDSPPPGGAAGYSPLRNPDNRMEPPRGAGGRRLSFVGRIHSDVGQKRKTGQWDGRDTRRNATTRLTALTAILRCFGKNKP